MAWPRRAQREDEHDPERDTEHTPAEEVLPASDGWEHLVEQVGPAADRLEARCNERGAQGWELVAALPLARLAFSSGGRTTGVQLFFKRRLP